MAGQRRKVLGSFEEIQKKAATLLAEVNADPNLARAAATNPILALVDLGYEISAEARADLEDRVRFGRDKAQRLKELRTRIFEITQHPFDLQSESELRRVLVEELKLQLPSRAYQKKAADLLARDLILPPQVQWAPKVPDPLEELRDVHPIVDPLLEYRRLEASEPRLATRELYDAVHQGKRRTPIVSIRGVLKAQSQ